MTRIFAAAALLAVAACAAPQGQTPSASASNPVLSQAAAGAVTEPQARMHAMNSGYSNVSTLVQGQDGMWRGNAAKGGQTVDLIMDPQGKITDR